MGTMGNLIWDATQDWERMESPGVSGAGTFKEIQLEGGKGLVLSHGDRGRKGKADPGVLGDPHLRCAQVVTCVYFVATTLLERGKGKEGQVPGESCGSHSPGLKPSPSPSPDLLH